MLKIQSSGLDFMLLVFALQLALPLVLIAWIAFGAPRSATGFWIQSAATAAALLAIALTGLWTFPPWWSPWVFAVLFILAVLIVWRRRYPFVSWQPVGLLAWACIALFFVIGGLGINQSAAALAGRELPPGTVVDLAFPLKGSGYLVVNGGSNLKVNAHLMTLDTSVQRFQAYRGQSYGVDMVKLNRWGLRASGLLPPQPESYIIYGEPVYAPCTGQVIAIQDGLPDMQVPLTDRTHMAGNHALLRCKSADILLGHFKPGSLRVAVGDQVTVGSPIAAVGNSGNTSEPHLHIHAQQAGTFNQPLSGNPLPMRFDGEYLVRNNRFAHP